MKRHIFAGLFLGLAAFAKADGVTDFIITPASTLVINAPGSYRLTGDVDFIGGAEALQINAVDVTVDLNGHSLRGGSINAGSSDRVTIRGGNIVSATGAGITATGRGARLSDLRVENVKGNGILVGDGARITRCSVLGVSSALPAPGAQGAEAAGIAAGDRARIEDCSTESVTGGPGGNGETGGNGGKAWGIRCGAGAVILRCEAQGHTGGYGGDSTGMFVEGGRGGDSWGIQAGVDAVIEACAISTLFGGPGGNSNFVGGSYGLAVGIQIAEYTSVRHCSMIRIVQGIGIRAHGIGAVIEHNNVQAAATGSLGIFVINGGCVLRSNTTMGHSGQGIFLSGNGSLCELNRTNDTLVNAGTNTLGTGDNANIAF